MSGSILQVSYKELYDLNRLCQSLGGNYRRKDGVLFTSVLDLLGPHRNLLLAGHGHGWSWMLCEAEGTKWK